MKTYEKLRLLMDRQHLSDKEVYRGINMLQPTFSSKKLGIKKFKPDEKRAIEKLCEVKEGYLDDDALPGPIINFSRADLANIVVDLLNKLANVMDRLAVVEAGMRVQGGRKKK